MRTISRADIEACWHDISVNRERRAVAIYQLLNFGTYKAAVPFDLPPLSTAGSAEIPYDTPRAVATFHFHFQVLDNGLLKVWWITCDQLGDALVVDKGFGYPH